MRITILHNPIAGSGRASRAGRELGDALRRDGHDVTLAETAPPGSDRDPLASAPAPPELLVVVGGDGTLRAAAERVVGTDTAVYQYPFGTENLFAREFGMTRDPERLRDAVRAGRVLAVDTGTVNGVFFLLMVSIGFDAEVVHELAENRAGAIRHWSYVRPILRQFRLWRPATLRVRVDADELVNDEPGMLIVANSRQYARRLDPARRCSMTDGRLDAVFMPTRTRAGLLLWVIRILRGRHLEHPDLRYRRGAHVSVESQPTHRYQMDGDPVPAAVGVDGDEAEAPRRMFVRVRPASLRVLVPPGRGAEDGS